MIGKDIKNRFEVLWTDRQIAQEVWDLIERFIYPIGGGKFFQALSSEGEMNWRRRNIYDDTAINGADTLAASVHGSLTSPAAKWFDLSFQDSTLKDDKESLVWLQECSDIVWSELQNSNFNVEMPEGYLDLVSFGNLVMTQEPIGDGLTWEGVKFSSIPLRNAYFEEDDDEQIHAVYRHIQWRATQCVDKFGLENCPEVIQQAHAKLDTVRHDIIYAVYPEPANKDANTNAILPSEERPFQFKYILRATGVEFTGEYATGGYYEMPAYIVRWRKAVGSQWGYGPGHIALSTVLTLNETIKLTLESAEKVIDPATMIQERGLLSDLDLTPGGQIIVKDVDKSLKPYESGARFDISGIQINDLRGIVNRIFHVDQLELKESPAMSATEVMVRYELMNRLLGPTMGRLQNDLIDLVVTNTFRMLFRANQLPAMPAAVQAAGGVVSVQYTGPLSRAQKSDDVAAAERWVANIGELANVFPDLRHLPDPIEIGKYLAEQLNVPAKLMRSDTDIKKGIKEDKEALQAQQQAEVEAKQAQAQGMQGGQ